MNPNTPDKIPWRPRFHREREQWIAWCPDLDVTTQGDTIRKADENLREAVSLFLETCHAMGTLEDVLREAGRFERCSREPPSA